MLTQRTVEKKRFIFDSSDDKKLQAFFFLSQSSFQYRNEIMSGQHQQHFSLLLPLDQNLSIHAELIYAFLRFAFVRSQINLVCATDIKEFQRKPGLKGKLEERVVVFGT